MLPNKEEYTAWAAGIFEGEGYTNKNHTIMISQKDPWILYKLQELYGGSVYRHERKEGGNDIYKYYLSGEKGRDLLKSFIPYLSPRRLRQVEDNGSLSILKRKNTCNKGHEYTSSNIRWLSDGRRACRICIKINRRRNGEINASA